MKRTHPETAQSLRAWKRSEFGEQEEESGDEEWVGNNHRWSPSKFDWVGDPSLKVCYSVERNTIIDNPGAYMAVALNSLMFQMTQGTGANQRVGNRVRIRHVTIKYVHRILSRPNGPFTYFEVYVENYRPSWFYKTYIDFKSVPDDATYGRWDTSGARNTAGNLYDEVKYNFFPTSPLEEVGSQLLQSGIPIDREDRFKCVQTHVCKDPEFMVMRQSQDGTIPAFNTPPQFSVMPRSEYWTYARVVNEVVNVSESTVGGPLRAWSRFGFDMFVIGPQIDKCPQLWTVESTVVARVVFQDE